MSVSEVMAVAVAMPHDLGLGRRVDAPAGGALALLLDAGLGLALDADALARREPLGARVPGPAVAERVADGQEPEGWGRAEDVQEVAAPAEVEGVGEAVAVALVEVGVVALHVALAFAALVGLCAGMGEVAVAHGRVAGVGVCVGGAGR